MKVSSTTTIASTLLAGAALLALAATPAAAAPVDSPNRNLYPRGKCAADPSTTTSTATTTVNSTTSVTTTATPAAAQVVASSSTNSVAAAEVTPNTSSAAPAESTSSSSSASTAAAAETGAASSEISGTADITWHAYTEDFSMTGVSCSDGANGLMTTMNMETLNPLFPYVTAWTQVVWNSDKCGSCLQVTGPSGSVFVTAIDHCEELHSGTDHLDLSEKAFATVFGDSGVGVGTGTFKTVAYHNCHANTLTR